MYLVDVLCLIIAFDGWMDIDKVSVAEDNWPHAGDPGGNG